MTPKLQGVGCHDQLCLLSKEVAAGEHPSEMPNSHSLVVSGFGELSFIFVRDEECFRVWGHPSEAVASLSWGGGSRRRTTTGMTAQLRLEFKQVFFCHSTAF